MPYIKYQRISHNGKRYKEFNTNGTGIVIEQFPSPAVGAFQTKSTKVAGLDSSIVYEDDAYDSYQSTLVLNVFKTTYTASNLFAIFAGSGWLYNSETGKWRFVSFYSGQSASRLRTPTGKNYDSVTFKMQCDSYEYLNPIMTGDELENDPSHVFTWEGDEDPYFTINGNCHARPIMVIKAEHVVGDETLHDLGDFTVTANNSIMHISGMNDQDELYIDCEARNIYITKTYYDEDGSVVSESFNSLFGTGVNVVLECGDDSGELWTVLEDSYTQDNPENNVVWNADGDNFDMMEKIVIDMWYRERWH